MTPRDLNELTTHCIRCGFCLESCPTFVTTGSEAESPRGRIYLVRSVTEGKLTWEDAAPHLDLCLGCRACETACPSGVEYGAILELARDASERNRPRLARRALLAGTTSPLILKSQLALARLLPGSRVPTAVSRWLSGQAPEVDLPQAQRASGFAGEVSGPEIRGEVYLLEGCAMRVLFPRVHLATRRLLRRVGFAVREAPQGCCGALHAHNGQFEEAQKMASRLAQAFAEDLPIVVNSAGCGSTMKESDVFGNRVVDLSEFLLAQGLTQALVHAPGLPLRITYHDACHLAHGQRIREAPRELLRAIPQADFVELEEADMCCGSAGIYNVTQPGMARTLVERKFDNVERTGASVVATGNPGCHAWIAQAARERGGKIDVLHTAELLESAFNGRLPD